MNRRSYLGKIFIVTLLSSCSIFSAVAAISDEQLHQYDLFVAGQGGYHTYRIPSLIVTQKGTVLAFCEGRKHSSADTGDIDLLVKRSSDGGETWSDSQIVWDDGPNTCGNPCAVMDRTTGTLWLFMTRNLGEDRESDIKIKKSKATRTVWISQSADDGKTWSPPIEITSSTKDANWGWYATGPGVGIQIENGPHRGRLVIPCDHSYNDPSKPEAVIGGSHVILSDDHGKSWRLGGTVRAGVNECQVAELADRKGTLLLSMRNYPRGTHRAYSISQDGGITWTSPAYDAQLIDPTCQASILACSTADSAARILFSNPASDRRKNLTVRLSRDNAKTWPVAKVLNEGPSAYSCLANLSEQRIACLYERGNSNPYEKITLARFSFPWLESK